MISPIVFLIIKEITNFFNGNYFIYEKNNNFLILLILFSKLVFIGTVFTGRKWSAKHPVHNTYLNIFSYPTVDNNDVIINLNITSSGGWNTQINIYSYRFVHRIACVLHMFIRAEDRHNNILYLYLGNIYIPIYIIYT